MEGKGHNFLSTFSHLATWNMDVIPGALVAILDNEKKRPHWEWWSKGISWYRGTMVCLFIFLVKDVLFVSSFSLLQIKLL